MQFIVYDLLNILSLFLNDGVLKVLSFVSLDLEYLNRLHHCNKLLKESSDK